MYPFASPALELKRRTASDAIPSWVIGLLAALQVVLWLAIIVLEGISVRYNAIQGTIYAGFWCSVIYFITWISMFCFLCCGKTNCCGIHLIVMNTIALCFSIVLVAFTAIFVNDPCKCYTTSCEIVSWITCIDRITLRKVPYLKGLLACGVLMLLSNLTYIVTYIAVSIWLHIRGNADMKEINASFQNRSANVGFGHQQQYPPPSMNYPSQTGEQQYPPYPMNYPSQTGEQRYPPYPMNYPSQIGEQRYPPYPMNYPSQIGEGQHPAHLINDGHRQPSPEKPMTQQQQPPQNNDVDEKRL